MALLAKPRGVFLKKNVTPQLLKSLVDSAARSRLQLRDQREDLRWR